MTPDAVGNLLGVSSDPDSLALDDVAGTLRVRGELDAYSAPALAEELEQRSAETSATIKVDLSTVTFMDSSALQVLVEYHRRLDGGSGSLVLISPSASVTRLFQVTGLDGRFRIER